MESARFPLQPQQRRRKKRVVPSSDLKLEWRSHRFRPHAPETQRQASANSFVCLDRNVAAFAASWKQQRARLERGRVLGEPRAARVIRTCGLFAVQESQTFAKSSCLTTYFTDFLAQMLPVSWNNMTWHRSKRPKPGVRLGRAK